MLSGIKTSIYLDTRRAKANGKYSLKLRVFRKQPRTQKLYSIDYEFTEAEFKSVWQTVKPRAEHKVIRNELQAIENRANEIISTLAPFDFEAFERAFFNKAIKSDTVNFYYQSTIESLKHNSRISTASNYELSLKALLNFHAKETLLFDEVTPQFLKDFEHWALNVKGYSLSTVGIYLRPLRAIFNNAIEDKLISIDIYPFTKRKYTIPAPRGVKKAFTKEHLSILFNAEPKTPEQARAKDFWFFSYACNGMNFKDIVNLKFKNLDGNTLTFYRAKTAKTNSQQAPVKVYLTDFALNVIKQYGNKNQSPESFIFNIVEPQQTPEQKHNKLKRFIRFVNQHFLNFAKANGIKENVSTYWARHSFATNAIRSGASMEFVSEALSHSNLNTTKAYFAGFTDEKKREIAGKLMDL
ncbi:MAG: tyrosine-type recombinase/integrase [Luteibaculaceae bacterium]